MANFIESKLTSDLDGVLARFEKKVQEQVLISGAAAMAKVIYDEARLNTSPPRMGSVTGKLHNAIYRTLSADRSSDTVKAYHISWNKRTAPHGHLLEYGTSRMAAKPFMRPAFEARIREAIEAGKQRMAERLRDGVMSS